MSKKLPRQLRDDIRSVRFMTIVMAICGAITIIGIPWAILYIILASRLKANKLPNRYFLNFTALATISIVWCLAPIFLLIGLLRLSRRTKLYRSTDGNKKFKTDKEWSDFRAWRRYGLAYGMVSLLILMIISVLPIPHTTTSNVNVPYATKYERTSNLELGEQKVKQKGVNGKGIERVREVKPIFAYIFGTNTYYSSNTLNTKTTRTPKKAVIAKGTKKYQYMWCSDGSSRMYTDKQLKNPDTGFTHKSQDDCAKNGQGKMTQLANSPPNGNRNVASASANDNSFCYKADIVPYKVVKVEKDYLAKGETETFGTGENGYTEKCYYKGQDEVAYTSRPLNVTMFVGTGVGDEEQNAAEQKRLETEKQQREVSARNAGQQASYNTYHSCILQVGGNSSAGQYWCPQVAQEAYTTAYNNYIANHPLY